MTGEEASILALRALAHVAGDEALLRQFLHESGVAPEDLARHAGEPEFLAGVLDFLLAREAGLLAFCEAEGLAPELPAQARRALPGGEPERS